MMRLTQSQELLWAGQKRDPEAPLYNMALAFAIEGSLDVARFVQANEQLGQVCETFRTVLREKDGRAFREVLEKPTAPLEILDFSEDPEAAKVWLDERAKRLLPIDRTLTDQALLIQSAERHLWFLNQHHLITDGATAGLVFDAVQRLYCGESVELPSFENYVAFEAKRAAPKASAYWEEKLATSPPASVTLYGRSLVVETVASERVVVSLGQERTAKLRALALSPAHRGFTEDLSMFQCLASLVFAFLHRQTGETHLGIATPTHNRPTPAFKRTPGVFIEVFPLEIQLGETNSFLDILAAVRNEALTYLTHAQGGQSRPELAARTQILLNVVNATFGAFDSMPTQTEWLHSGCGDRQHALRLAVYDFDDSSEYRFLFDFNKDAFGRQERQWAIDHLFKLIDAILADPSQAIHEIALAETRETLVSTPIQEGTVLDQFEEQRWEHPDRVALSGPCAFDASTGSMTYEVLDQRANQLANHLADLGISKGHHVAILLEPSLEWVVSMLAILKTGAAYFPVSTEEPTERLAWLLEDTASKLVITRHALSESLPEATVKVLLDAEESAIGSAPDVAPSRDLSPEDRFYLISTSGSTGKPKAVCGRHVSVINLLEDLDKRSPLPEGATATWWTSPTFDVSIYEIWSALYHGHTLHIVPQADRPSSEKVLSLLQDEGIQLAYLPVYMLPDLATGKHALPKLRRLLVGVEPIQQGLLGQILQRFPDLTIINGYGPAEATICCTLHTVCADPSSTGITPIGRPVQNTTLYVLDAHRQAVPMGAPGELYVGGVGLAEGYWNRPELNSTRFVPNPFSEDPRDELYRTGDRVRYLPNGDLEFLGRVDEQLKVRGHRIEPGEIIAALESHSSVRQAALRVWPPSRLVAYVSLMDPATDPDSLRAFLETKLPRYMVPSQVLALDALPQTINGKVDLAALPEPTRNASESLATSESEVALAKIWSQVFGLEQVGVDENFFDLGGDSILSIRIVAQAHQAGIRLTTPQIFEHQTIAGLAKAARPTQDLAVSEAYRVGPVPRNAIQHWFFDQAFAHPEVFNHQLILQTTTDRATMERRLNCALAHHDAFRLSFNDNQPALAESAPLLALTEMPDMETARARLNEPFQLDQAPLVRAAWVEPGTLVLVAHHLIVDGVSWAILTDTLQQEEASIRKTTGFGTWCQTLDEKARSGAFQEDAAYWRAQDSGLSTLPLDLAATDNLEVDRCILSSTLPANDLTKASAPVQDLLLTGIASAISHWTQQDTVRIDLEGHGREAELLDLDLTCSLGWFTSLFPLSLPIERRATPASRLATVSQRLRSLPRHGSSYGVLAYQDPKSGLTPQPSEILFNYLGQVDGQPVQLIRHPANHRSHVLEIDAVIADGQLHINWHYSKKLHTATTIQGLADHCVADIEALLHKPKPTSPSLDKKTMGKLAQLLSKADKAS